MALPQVSFSNLKRLVIKFCPKIKWIFTLSLIKTSFQSLQELQVEGCDELETIVAKIDQNVGDGQEMALPYLKTLKLRRLPKLISIWHGGVLGNDSIEEISIEYCADIKLLFVHSLARPSLRNLKEIKVTCCENLQEIIASPDCIYQDSRINELPNFKSLQLDDLPHLRNVFPRDQIPVCISIEEIVIRDCPNIRKLPISIPISSNGELCLKDIKAGREWWNSLEWDNLHLKNILQPFTVLAAGKSISKICTGLASSPGRDLHLKDVSGSTEPNGEDISSCVFDA